jgi:hypothetical protein
MEVSLPTKRFQLENRKSVKGNHQGPMAVTTSSSQAQGENFSSKVDIRLNCALVLENSNGNAHTQAQASSHEATITIDELDVNTTEASKGPKCAATQLKAVRQARVSFASARSIAKPFTFVPLDPDSIRRGFQKGGASSK